jgi:general secretion pathway protein J
MLKTLIRKQTTLCSPKGFTLLELLLAVAILMLIVGIIGGAFRLSVRCWEKGEEEVEEFRKTRIVLSKLAQQIKSFYPYWLKKEEEWSLAFEGQSQVLTFVSPVSLLSPFITGLVCVQYGLEYDDTSDNGSNLIVREFRVIDGESLEKSLSGGVLGGSSEATLLTGLEGLTFDYYVVPEDAEEGQWQQSWVMAVEEEAEEVSLPQAIRITLTQRPAGAEEDDEEAEPIITAMTIPLVTAPFHEVSAVNRKLGKTSRSSASGAKGSLPPPPGSTGEKSPFGHTPGRPGFPGGGAGLSDSPFAPNPGGPGGSGGHSSPFGR